MVAEKPSLALSIAKILSKGESRGLYTNKLHTVTGALMYRQRIY